MRKGKRLVISLARLKGQPGNPFELLGGMLLPIHQD